MTLLGEEGSEGTADNAEVAVETVHPQHTWRPVSWSSGSVDGRVEGKADQREASKLRQLTGLYVPGPGTGSSLR